ncbi:MAG: YciI family protein [Gammaproteobacteria bacterium TMED182]|nr:hypothetical protein [Gammaproteobacteria bacterium]RPG52928.1 MAG: YciI family protein [Gammaproteobacteria bacterium TMED182]
MLYVIIGEDRTDSLSARMDARPAHLERIQALVDQGRLIIGGPMPAIDSENPGEHGFKGSIIIAEFTSLEEAETWAFADPYQLEGIFETLTVRPFKQVLP